MNTHTVLHTASMDPLRSRAGSFATASSCCGIIGETVLADSAVILLFAGLLGASARLSLFTTSVLPLLNGLLIIPFAMIGSRIGARKLLNVSCIFSGFAFMGAVLSPYAGAAAVQVLVLSVILFSLMIPGFIAGWFPLLDSFLAPGTQAEFCGRMRFRHQLAAVIFLGIAGALIGPRSGISTLQLIMFCAAVIFWGRWIFITRIPDFPAAPRKAGSFKGLLLAMRDRDLVLFSVLQFIFNFAASGMTPLILLQLKEQYNYPDNLVIFMSAAALLGLLAGYSGSGRLICHVRLSGALLAVHLLLIGGGIFLALLPGGVSFAAVIALLLFAVNFAGSAFSVMATTGMMQLTPRGNKVISMALCGAFFYLGNGITRLSGVVMLNTFGYRCIFLFYCLCAIVSVVFLKIFLYQKFNSARFEQRSSYEIRARKS